MSAATMNAPLPFTKEAIIGNFQVHATNGPAYVQLQATRALARLKGMYEEARLLARSKFQTQQQDAWQPTGELSPVEQATADGEDITSFHMYATTSSSEDDEEAANQEKDEVP